MRKIIRNKCFEGVIISSVWSNNVEIKKFNSLEEDIKTDVLIIGGGMAGILCSYFLTKSGIDCVLVEKERICSGITKNTTAKITSQHGLIYDKIISEYSEENAKMYLDANEKAIKDFKELSKKIDCDFEVKDAFLYSINDVKKLDEEMKALEKLGFSCEFCSAVPLPFDTCGAIKFKNQAQFNPLKFVKGIVTNLRIYENTKVIEIRDNVAICENARINAKKFIVATHFPFMNKYGAYFLKMYQKRSYVVALSGAENVDGMYIDENENGMSFRNYKDLLFVGGGGHRTGKYGGNYNELEKFCEKYYKDAKEEYRWAAQDCMTLDSIPYIGEYSKKTPNILVATGFNKWGMTSSMVSAKILCDKVLDRENEYESVFFPSRSIIHPQLFVNTLEATKGLLTISEKRCPHLGCALKWNNEEHSWDCSCHGSRFDEKGKLLDNPATYNLKK